MKIKRLLSLILCVAMVFTATQITTSYADDTISPKVYVESVSAMQGSSVTVYVGIQNAVDLGGLDVSVFYDAEAMTVSSANRESFLDGASVSINTNTAGTVKESIVAMDGLNGDGYLMSINFNISEDAAVKDYALTVGIGEAFDTSLNNITVDRSSGTLTVTKNESIVREVYFYSYFDPSDSVSEGDEVHFKVIANDANGLAGGTFDFTYDPEILEFKDAALGEELKSGTAIYSVNSRSPGLVRITYAEIEAITENYGVEFFDISFTVKKDIAASTTVSFSGSSLLDANLNNMITGGTSSTINVVKKASKLYVDWNGVEGENRKFTVDVILTGDSNVGAGDFRIDYDTSKLSCEAVETDSSVADSGAYLVTKEDTSGGRISFSYVNSNGCSTDATLLHITFKQLHGITGDTEFVLGGRDVVDKDLNDIILDYPSNMITMPYDEGHIAEIEPAVAPTCEETGLTEGSHCSVCGKTLVAQEVVPAIGHNWRMPTYTWSDDNSMVTAERVCANDPEHKEIETVSTKYEVIAEATETASGAARYISEPFASEAFEEQIKQIELPPTGYKVSYEWSSDNTKVTGIAIPYDTGADTVTETVDAAYTVVKEPTCTENGTGAWTSASFSNSQFAVQTKEAEIAALGHELVHHEAKAATCEEKGWNAYDTCSRCDYTTYAEIPAKGHTSVTDPSVAPTCTETGLTEGTHCSVCGKTLIVQEAVPATGHNWREPTYTWSTDNSKVIGERVCDNDSRHKEIETVNATFTVTKEPTCIENGTGIWTSASFSNSQFTVQTKEVEIEALGHDLTHHAAKAATCEEKGWDEYDTCSRCDYSTYVEIPATGHTSGNAVRENEVEATCVDAGSYDEVIYCTVCGKELSRTPKAIAALGHDLIHHEAKAATCEEKGWDEYDFCSRCDYTTYIEIPAKGHTTVNDPAVAPTCTKIGYTEGSHCSVCGKVLEEQKIVPATGHSWKDPTYTWSDDNSKVTAERVCANDPLHVESENVGTSYAEITPATETAAGTGRYTTNAFANSAFEVQTKDIELPPTGYEVYYEWSDDNRNVTGFAVPFDAGAETIKETVTAEYTVIMEPTCTEKGAGMWTSTAFSNSQFAVQTKEVEIEALGHELIYHEGKAATCEENGWAAYDTCSRCDYTTYAEIPATGHTPGEAARENEVAATCMEAGSYEEVVYCTVCNKELSRNKKAVPALGHDIKHHEAKDPTCEDVGWEAYDACSRCDYTTYVEIPATGHTPVMDPAVAPTCGGTGLTEGNHCSVCGKVIVEQETIAALGHDWGEWVVIKEATTTEEGLERRTCLRDESHFEERAIPKKVPEKTGWIKEDGYWYFYESDGTMAVSTWKKDSKGWCYLAEDGRMVTNGWAKDTKGWVYVGSDGYMVTGTKWIKYDGGWYHITNGYRDQSKWMKDSQGWCWLQEDGRMLTNGWAKDSKGWCWIAANGYMPTTTQWIKYDGSWYHITKGYRDQNKWMKDSQGWCWLQADGRMLTNGWAKDSKGWCWIAANGYMPTTTQWVKYDDGWYHITKGYRDENKWMKDSKGWCWLQADGRMLTNGWAKDTKGWCWIGEAGYMIEEDMWIGEVGAEGSSYIIKGYRVDDQTIEIDGVEYTFDQDGKLVNKN